MRLRFGTFILVAACLASLAACGGGSDKKTTQTSQANPPTGPNVVSIAVDAGPDPANLDSVNAAYASVTICAPSNPSLCQTVNHLLVDSGSYGLRILHSVLSSDMANALSAQNGSSTLNECTTFVDGYSWGPIRQVNFAISGESVSNMNIQIIGDPAFAGLVPSSCASAGPSENTVDSFGSNGVIGVGMFSNDCDICVTQQVGSYFNCTAGACTGTTVPVAQQVSNPVSQFGTDNNGVIIELPAVPLNPPSTVTGSMVFGIGTQSNNALGGASVFQMDQNGEFTTQFAGSIMPNSFVDSGSNALYFPNVTSLATCADGFYCPGSTVSLTALMQGVPNLTTGATATKTVAFSIGHADSVTGSVSVDFGAPNATGSFDWGLPFFYGRNVYIAQSGKAAGGQTGPFMAY